jgi:uncharacterized protein (TIGR02996 family)
MFDEDEAAFHRAILAQPDEPMNFRIYADWLEERGWDERASRLRALDTVTVQVLGRACIVICPQDHRIHDLFFGRNWSGYDLESCAVISERLYNPDDTSSPWQLQFVRQLPIRQFRVRADGTTDANDQWLGWLLALALAHGWRMPELELA